MKYKTQKAGEQQDEFEAKGQQMEQMFAQNANESDSGRNWINGTYELVITVAMKYIEILKN